MQRVIIVCAVGSALALGGRAAATTLQIVDDPSLGTFFDISLTSGIPIALGDDEETLLSGSVPGNFVIQTGFIVVGMNGGVGFGMDTVTDLGPVNQPLPSRWIPPGAGKRPTGSRHSWVFSWL